MKASLNSEQKTINELKQVYKQARKDIKQNIIDLNSRQDMQNIQTIVYQKKYQEALLKQVEGTISKLEKGQYSTVEGYLTDSYYNGYVGHMYDLQYQGIPITVPINQKRVVMSVQTNSNISTKLYTIMGENVTYLKNSIRAELSRGAVEGLSWFDIAERIANGMNSPFNKALNRTVTIARTEGHRVQEEANFEAMQIAKDKGADQVKQWDATLDSRTRPAHQEADGQLRELDEFFDVGGEKMKAPHIGGSARNVVNCRCHLLARARWALNDAELKTLQDRAKFFGLDKSKDFEDYKQKYLKLPKNADKIDTTGLTNFKKITISNTEVLQYERSAGLGDGYGGIKKTVDAIVYRTSEGVEFVFPKKLNKSRQKMTPEQLMEAWEKIPENIRKQSAKTVTVLDYYNPADSYWKKRYKNFTHSYMTGGLNGIDFYRYDYEHDDEYLVHAITHEISHVIDATQGSVSGLKYSDSKEWTDAMREDLLHSGAKSPTSYGENANSEDFAESIGKYTTAYEYMEKLFPNRTKFIRNLLKKG